MNNIIFSICARGGSKGLPNKNISEFMGMPLIAVTIQQAKLSKYCNDIYVSTDCKDISNVVQEAGAKCIQLRPEHLSDDHASKFDVWKYHLNFIESNLKINFNYFFDLDCTCPLRTTEDIDNMIDSFLKIDNYDGVITVCDSRKNPYFNMLEAKNSVLKVSKELPDNIIRRQDAPQVIDHVASMYLFRTNYIRQAKSLFEGRVIGYKVPYERSIDIDSESDKKMVEHLYKNLNRDLGKICL